ncbi:MAG: MBL fold metallo-hydrolase, partial [Promethearchaeota archaeon]
QLGIIDSIKTICLTHLHNDHFLGLFSLLWHYWINQRSNDVTLIGPKGTQETVETILTLINTPKSMRSSYEVRYIELNETLEPRKVMGIMGITYISVEHRIPALAYKIERNGKSFCYTGDSKLVPTLIHIARGCDTLACESTFPDELADFAHKHYHFTPADAAELALETQCKKLILVHISSYFIDQLDIFKQQAEQKLRKSVILAEDLMEIVL